MARLELSRYFLRAEVRKTSESLSQICNLTDDQYNGPDQTQLLQECFSTKTAADLIAFDDVRDFRLVLRVFLSFSDGRTRIRRGGRWCPSAGYA